VRKTERSMDAITMIAEPGVGGGQLSVGALRLVDGRPGLFYSAKLQASVLRTWGWPWVAPAGRNYVGAEAQVKVPIWGFGVGGYWSPGSGRGRRLLSISLIAGLL